VKLTDREEKIITLTKSLVMNSLKDMEPYALGHGFLWGYVTINRRQKNGKLKTFKVKTLFGGICLFDHKEAKRRANSIPGVSSCWINLD